MFVVALNSRSSFLTNKRWWLWVPAQGRDDTGVLALSPEPCPAIEPGEIVIIVLRRLRAHDGIADAGVFACGVIDVLADQAGLQLHPRGAGKALRAVFFQRRGVVIR